MTASPVGFIGLGNMGRPMAENIALAGHSMVVFDAAGAAGRAPEGATAGASVAAVAGRAEVILTSLPDGGVVKSVVEEILATPERVARTLVDLSTVGIEAAREIAGRLADAGMEYADAPVSGGVSGARARTISVMFAGAAETYARLEPVLSALSQKLFHVGPEPGQGQAMKLLNNFLSGTAMAATSEAVSFGVTQGLDMQTVLDVLNVSSGRNSATADKFLHRVLTGTFDAGFTTGLITKDIGLFLEAAARAGTSHEIGEAVGGLWRRLADSDPGGDFSRVYPFVDSLRKR